MSVRRAIHVTLALSTRPGPIRDRFLAETGANRSLVEEQLLTELMRVICREIRTGFA